MHYFVDLEIWISYLFMGHEIFILLLILFQTLTNVESTLEPMSRSWLILCQPLATIKYWIYNPEVRNTVFLSWNSLITGLMPRDGRVRWGKRRGVGKEGSISSCLHLMAVLRMSTLSLSIKLFTILCDFDMWT
jgi:hypothetical protein